MTLEISKFENIRSMQPQAPTPVTSVVKLFLIENGIPLTPPNGYPNTAKAFVKNPEKITVRGNHDKVAMEEKEAFANKIVELLQNDKKGRFTNIFLIKSKKTFSVVFKLKQTSG